MRIKGPNGLLKKCNLTNNDIKRKHIPIRNRYWKKEKMRILHKIIENNSRYFIDNYWSGGVLVMAFTRDEIKQLDRLNKKKAVWEKHGVSNMAIRNVDNMLENFYMGLAEQGYNISNNMERFTMRSDLTPEQERQLLQIADYMESHKTTSMGYYNKKLTDSAQKAYDTAIEKGYVTAGDRQSYIDFVDFMNESQAVKESAEMLGSAVIARIYGYGKDKGLTSDEINDLIINNYSDFKNGDMLQNYIFDEIDTIYENRHSI